MMSNSSSSNMMMASEGGEGVSAAEGVIVAASSRGGVGGSESGRGLLKKGPWTAAEDAILMEYVKKHGEGNWNAVQKNSGLARCGKSCRLRWANHLRPNLKKGSFSPEEERIIIELHAKLGNKWARMASQLPGRTDNEIKNYWNTRMKRRQRAGLPLYPHEVQQEVAAFHLQQHHHHHHQRHPNSSPSSASFSPLLSSSTPRMPHHSSSSFPFYDHPINFSTAANPNHNHHHRSPFYSNPTTTVVEHFNSNGGFAIPLSSVSTAALFNHNVMNSTQMLRSDTTPPSSIQYNSGGSSTSSNNFSFSSLMEPTFEPMISMVSSSMLISELPSTQTMPVQSTTTPASSNTSTGCEGFMGTTSSSNGNDHYDFAPPPPQPQSQGRNSGLLDALLVEAETRSQKSKAVVAESNLLAGAVDSSKGKNTAVEERRVQSLLKNSGGETSTTAENQTSSSQSSIGMLKPSEDPLMEDMNSMDDDLMSLLNNFPTTMPVPDWYPRSNILSHGETSSAMITGKSGVVGDVTQNPSPTPPSPKHDRNLDACYWNNMPGIC
ncbi:hypothetical protein FEM48_Zijuj04G0091700 [Ziziphus jujuba var. spinosa]|uniref:Transcription factor MYB101 n=1 Tax=Ziziphus jujuba var. spinosa TaxID=714518 RepID=A0A978VJ04_ZIZJJ|nr:transcription factor MYB101-like [Ziziphus jujuba var. spinosa]KAH7533073.1 hypothetical protein FEM48_Zijuj04G0091700 [Ziziphus jujuba var. spinosa]